MTARNELIPLLHELGLARGVVLYNVNGKKIISQLHRNNYSNWTYIDNHLKFGHVLLYPDGTTNHVQIFKWEELNGNHKK